MGTLELTQDNKKDKMLRRILLTWNNPFWENQFEIGEDIENCGLKLNLEKYNLDYLKDSFNSEFFEFKYIKYLNAKTEEIEVVERPFFKNATAVENYIANLNKFRYCAFQVEKGGNSELTHIQAFITFKNPFHWSTMCNRFPVANFEEVRGSNTQARQYCTKPETRIDGPYEFGEFAEERQRTDIKEFLELLEAGASNNDLKKTHPSLYLREFNKLSTLRAQDRFDEFCKKIRNVEVTFVYGPPGVGKSTYVYEKVGFENSFSVQTFDNSAFTFYEAQDNLIIDEFNCQWSIQFMNKLLDRFPLQLRGLGCVKWACYQQVYIISNYSLSELYRDKQETEPTIYKSFLRRFDNIIRFDCYGNMHYEKQKQKEFQVEMTEIKSELEF